MKRFWIFGVLLAALFSAPAFSASENVDTTVTVASTAGGTVVIAANPKRLSLCLQNTGSVALFCSKGSNVPTTTIYGVQINNGTTIPPFCQYGPLGAVIYKWTCIAASATGTMSVSATGN